MMRTRPLASSVIQCLPSRSYVAIRLSPYLSCVKTSCTAGMTSPFIKNNTQSTSSPHKRNRVPPLTRLSMRTGVTIGPVVRGFVSCGCVLRKRRAERGVLSSVSSYPSSTSGGHLYRFRCSLWNGCCCFAHAHVSLH